jgi:hypothetical protein
MSLQENLISIINYNLDSEYDVKILDSNFVKLFKLAQLSVEYLMYSEQHAYNCMELEHQHLKKHLKVSGISILMLFKASSTRGPNIYGFYPLPFLLEDRSRIRLPKCYFIYNIYDRQHSRKQFYRLRNCKYFTKILINVSFLFYR